MFRTLRRLAVVMALTLPVLSGCSNDVADGAGLVPAQLSLAQGSTTDALLAAALDGGAGGRIELGLVDSLIVHVTRVEVLPESLLLACHPPVGDSARGFRPQRPDSAMRPPPPGCRRPGLGPMGPGMGGLPGGGRFGFPPIRPDSLRPDSGWGRRADQWYTLTVEGDGRLDLVNLPTDAGTGLLLASGDVPAGDYGAARLFVSDATIWLNTAITTDSGVTLEAGVGYPVTLPRMADRMGIATGAGFTVPEGGGTVALVFDAAASVGGIVVTSSGEVRIRPVIRPRPPRP